MEKVMEISCGIIYKNSKVLICQRPKNKGLALKWEFPGGKIESNETLEECLHREIKEELNIEIKILRKLTPYKFDYPEFSVILNPFICNYESGDLIIFEHNQILWEEIKNLDSYDWAEADIELVKLLQSEGA